MIAKTKKVFFLVLVFIGSCTYAHAFAPTSFHYGTNVCRNDASVMFMSQQNIQPFRVFPVMSRIAGINWTGDCRYVGADLVPISELKLTGGIRYDLNGTSITLSSFLTFPNGNTREVMMKGNRNADGSSPIILRSVEEGGPIYLQLTELGTDTILINEVEETTGKTVLTSSLSVIQSSKGMQLVQISHEVGEGKDSIEGHQVWRLTGGPVEFDDFDFRDGTGW